MDLPFLIKQRLKELGLDQRDLAAAAQVTESYISQLLSRKKAPPAPGRTDIYEKIGELPEAPGRGTFEAGRPSAPGRVEEANGGAAAASLQGVPGLFCANANADRRREMRGFSRRNRSANSNGWSRRRLLDVAQGVAKEELASEEWLRLMAQLSGRSYEQMRVAILEFLDTDVFNVSVENCVSFLDPMIDSWDIDLKTFGMEIVLNRRLTPGSLKRFEFVEREPDRQPSPSNPALKQFLRDHSR